MPINPNIQRLPGETDAAYRMRQYGMDPSNPIVNDTYLPPEMSAPVFGDDIEEPEEIENPEKKTLLQKIWGNRKDIAKGTLYGINALASYGNEVRQDMDYENAMRKRFQQDPIFDYNNLYGNGQPIIKAEDGMEVRTPSSKAAPINIEGGEFLILPDGTTELAKGPKHKDGGIPTILPDKSIVYSNKLKPEGSKKTFAELAKKQDYTHELEVLENPFSKPESKTASERMIARKQKTLAEIFKEQQLMNNNSSGELMEDGGSVNFSKTKLDPIREKQFKSFYATLPDNLRSDDDTYDIRGYWDALGQPSKFDYSQPKENDGYYHGFSRHPVSGKILKAPSHPTFKKAIDADYRQGYEPIVKNGNVHTLQKSKLDPTGLLMKNGGKIEYEPGGEYDLDEKEIKRLQKLGYKIEIL